MLTSAVIFLSFLVRLSLLSYLRCRRLPHRLPQRQLYQPLHRRLTYLVVKNSKNKQPKGQRLVQREEEEEEHNWRQPQLFRFGEPHKTEALTRLQVGRWKAHVDYIVLTSVDRDDLPDGGSGHFAQTVKTMKVCTKLVSFKTCKNQQGGHDNKIFYNVGPWRI